jgi:SAM-dependent methyltransferase
MSCIVFGVKCLDKKDIERKKVIEIGSYHKDGSLRPIIQNWKPSSYLGIDIRKGTGVDMICNVENLVDVFGKECFDIVICTELLEHVRDWKRAVSNIKNICKRGGIILITTRSHGYWYHAAPIDFWRYERHDMKNIFADCKIELLEKDFQAPGVFAKIRKPRKFVEKDLSTYKLYNIISNKRVINIKNREFLSLRFLSLTIRHKIRYSIIGLGYKIN